VQEFLTLTIFMSSDQFNTKWYYKRIRH